jgi:D-lactate dehydrogenase
MTIINPLPAAFINEISRSLPENQWTTDPTECLPYGYDNSRKLAPPQAVAHALSHEEVQLIVKLCCKFNVPITARGRATGTTGGAIPIEGGIVLSCERMDKIIEVDPQNRFIRAQAGVLNSEIQAAVREYGYFWPPDPTSAAYCSIGGNLACNAAGPSAIKYGTTRENTLGLKAVIGTGESIECGVLTTKGVVGYDFTRLLIGSEGTLGIITEATLKLTPIPQSKMTFCGFYRSLNGATQAVVDIMSQPVVPRSCEFLDGHALDMIRNHSHPGLIKAQGMILVEIDGTPAQLEQDKHAIENSARNSDCLDWRQAANPDEVKALWHIRKSLSPALRSVSPHKINEDVVVPVTNIPALLEFIHFVGGQYSIPNVNFGHAGNGNIHVNLLVDPLNPTLGPVANDALNEIFEKVIALGGTLSGEHGVGIEKRDFVAKEIDPPLMALMKRVKKQFDPKGIMNPGKMFP